mmetsp:Transcript_80504/g.180104  ORF Transcript_80504/g.180104 Transcript_80504/m.180104 type:complete len:242 (-) Transcript_80504:99-824(-)
MIAVALAEKRALAAQALASSTPSSRASDPSVDTDVSCQSFLERREAELAVRKALRSKVEKAAKQKVDLLNGRDGGSDLDEPEELHAAKRSIAAGLPMRPQIIAGECVICGSAIEEKHAKRLPCGHVFHFACIDDFHRQKMRREKDVSLPCYTCKAPTHRSINVLADERKAKREAEAARVAQEAEAARVAEAEAELAKAAAATAGSGFGRRQSSVPRRRGGALAALARAAQGGGARPDDADS